jgi:hypothetical protein
MTTATQYPHIQIDDAGTAYIGSSRYKVLHLAGEHYLVGQVISPNGGMLI